MAGDVWARSMTEVIQTMIPMIDLAVPTQPVRETTMPLQAAGAPTFDVIFDDRGPELANVSVLEAALQRSESTLSVAGSNADCWVMPVGEAQEILRVQTRPVLAVQHPEPETHPITKAGSNAADKAVRPVGFDLRDAVRMAMELLPHQGTTLARTSENVSDDDGPDIVVSDPKHLDIALSAGPVPQIFAVAPAGAPQTPADQSRLPHDPSRVVGQANAVPGGTATGTSQISPDPVTVSQHVAPEGEPSVQPGRVDVPVPRDRIAPPETTVAKRDQPDRTTANAETPKQAPDRPLTAAVMHSPMPRVDVAGREGATQQPTELWSPDAKSPTRAVGQDDDLTDRPVADLATGRKSGSDKANLYASQAVQAQNPVAFEAVVAAGARGVDVDAATPPLAVPAQPSTDRPIRTVVQVETVADATLSVAAGPMSRDAALTVRRAVAKPVVPEADPRSRNARFEQTPDVATPVSAPTAAPVLATAPHPGGAGATPGAMAVPLADLGSSTVDDIMTVQADAGVFASGSTAVDILGRDPGAPASAPTAPAQAIAILVARLSGGAATADTIELALSPEELGSVRIEFQANGDRLQVVLSAERTDTLDLLRRNADQLVAELRAAGYASATLNFGQWGTSHDGDKSQHHVRVQSHLTLDSGSSSPTNNRSFATTGGGLDIRL